MTMIEAMTDYESLRFMLLLPFSMEGGSTADYSLDEIQAVLRFAQKIDARATAAEAEVARLSDRVKGLTGALELARAFVVKAHVDGAYSNTVMTGDTALRIINEALDE